MNEIKAILKSKGISITSSGSYEDEENNDVFFIKFKLDNRTNVEIRKIYLFKKGRVRYAMIKSYLNSNGEFMYAETNTIEDKLFPEFLENLRGL